VKKEGRMEEQTRQTQGSDVEYLLNLIKTYTISISHKDPLTRREFDTNRFDIGGRMPQDVKIVDISTFSSFC
jgi:hypothetical protein